MEELKDLGGLVNKDLAFSKLPQGVVFDSQNFRVTTNDGNTTAARENIKGTVSIAGFQPSPCVKTITFDPDIIFDLLLPGSDYVIDTTLDFVAILPQFSFTYVDLNTLINDYVIFLRGLPQIINEAITITSNANGVITYIAPNCNDITINLAAPGRPNTPVEFPYQIIDPNFDYDPTNFNSVNGTTGSTGPLGIGWFGDYEETPFVPTTFMSVQMQTGISDYSGTVLDPSATVVIYDVIATNTFDSMLYTESNYFAAASSASSVNFLDYVSGGPFNVEFSFYVAKSLNTDLTIKVFLLPNDCINQAVTTANGVLTDTPTPGVSVIVNPPPNLVLLLQTYNIPVGSTDANYLNNAAGFTYLLPNGLTMADICNTACTGIWAIAIQVSANNPGFGAYDFKLYLDRFSITGPPLNLNAAISYSTISTSAAAGLIIGWTALRDDIYLFTTDGVFDPDDPTTWGGPTPPVTKGEIWKLSYDKGGNYASNLNYNLSLVYSNNLNFTTCRPIANPGMIESRYENPSIQKIYWTDNYNVPRQINVADPNVANLLPAELNLQPSLSMDMPFVTQVMDGGGLLIGVYQVAYRLKNINGSESRFSRTSQSIPIIDAQEQGADVTNYFPRGAIQTAANKSIRVKVNNIDISYDTIEFALIYYYDETSPPDIFIAQEEFIQGSTMEVIISGNGTLIPITPDEFTAFNSSIIRCKTLAAKKQTLFLGNITIADQVIDFDARTYRFPINSNTTRIRNNSTSAQDTIVRFGNSYTLGGNPIPKTHGAYQTYADQAPNLATNYLYQPNTNILGGAGPNVKYEFFTENVGLTPANSNGLTFGSASSSGIGNPLITPNTAALITFNSLDSGNYTSAGSSLTSYASPYVYDLYVGYRRDEMYRFGIVFFDELDNPTYVNWIGDIRMPHPFMPFNTAGASGLGGGRNRIGHSLNASFTSSPSYLFWNNGPGGNAAWYDLYAKPLGVKFTIDFSSVANKYKRASIVRAPLEQENKHILGQGIHLPTYKTINLSTDGTNVFLCSPFVRNAARRAAPAMIANEMWLDSWTFRSTDFLFQSFPGYVGGDAIDIIGIMLPVKADYLQGKNGVNGFYTRAEGTSYQGYDNWTALTTLAFDFAEGTNYPATIKNPVSNNPYPLATAREFGNAASTTTSGRSYVLGSTTISNGGFGGTGGSGPRTINGCAPKELAAAQGGGIITPTAGGQFARNGYSYSNKCVYLQYRYVNSFNWDYTNPIFFPAIDPWFFDTSIPGVGNRADYSRYISNYKRNVVDPYGGQDYFSRAATEYIPCNNLIDITLTSSSPSPIKQTKVFGGDTIISVLDHVDMFVDRAEGVAFGSATGDLKTLHTYMPLETNVAVEYRRSANNQPYSPNNYVSGVPNRNDVFLAWGNPGDAAWYNGTGVKLESNEYFFVDRVFNYTRKKSLYTYFSEPAVGSVPTEYDCRIWRSEKKIDGENTESWSIFKPGAFLDVESAYGPLNNLVVFQDKLHFIQDRGFGVLQVAEQKLISDAAGTADLVLGSSGILERYDYISTKTGTKHQFSMNVSDYSMIWFDTLARKMYRYKPGALEPLSDIKGYSAFVYNNTGGAIQNRDNPYYMDPTNPIVAYTWLGTGVHSTYDYRHNEFYVTILDPNNIATTLVYNDLFDGYIGKYSLAPKVYINDKVNIFAPAPTSPQNPLPLETIHILNYGPYGRFFGAQFTDPSYLSFVVNSNPTLEKTFTNLEVVAEAYKLNTFNPQVNPFLTQYDALAEIDYQDFFEQMRVFNNYQNTDWQFLDGSSGVAPVSRRRHKTIWNLKVLSDRVLDVNSNIFDSANLDPNRPRLTRKLKDKWFVVELRYNNNSNNRFVVHTAKAIYSANSR